MFRKWYTWVIAAIAAIAVMAAIVVVRHLPQSETQPTIPNDNSVEVGSEGGTFPLHDGIEVYVPPDAVEDGTMLFVGNPSHIADSVHAPFDNARTGALSFDVSLSKNGNNDVQPEEPLTITIPLEGNFLPEGADPTSALMYSELASSPSGFWRMPSLLEGTVLKADLYSLSLKYIAFLDQQAYLDNLWFGDEPAPECESIETSTGTVEFGSNTEGWSNSDESSLINACLQSEDDMVYVDVINRVDTILSATSDDMDLEVSPGDAEEELVKYFASKISSSTDAYVGRNGGMEATVNINDLPATVELRANADTFLIEAGWFALKVVVDIFTGGAGTEAVRALVELSEVTSCIGDALDIASGDGDLLQVVNLLVSTCTEVIAKGLGVDQGWGLFGRWFKAVGYLVEGFELLVTAFTGFTMQFSGGMTIEVVRSAPDCPSSSLIEGYVREDPSYRDLSQVDVDVSACEGDWALAYVVTSQIGQDGVEYENQIGFALLLHWSWAEAKWSIALSGQDMDATHTEVDGVPLCEHSIPSSVRSGIWCY